MVARRRQERTGIIDAAGVCLFPPSGRSDKAIATASAICGKPCSDRGFKPSRRLSQTTGQRSVSALRVAFLVAQATKWRARSKPARARFTLRAPRWRGRCWRTCSRRLFGARPRSRLHMLPLRMQGRSTRRRGRGSAPCRRSSGVRASPLHTSRTKVRAREIIEWRHGEGRTGFVTSAVELPACPRGMARTLAGSAARISRCR